MKPSLTSCWYPFRSPEVRAIYDNLTPDEASRLKQYSWKVGGPFGAIIGLMMFPVCLFLIQYVEQPWGIAGIFAVAITLGLIIGLIGGAPIRSKAKKILCESTYAKEKGYTPETLRLYSFGK